MSNIPFLSIIIPVYNTPKDMLEANIKSILSQKGDFEIIYINDGSTAIHVDEMLAEASSNDKRVLYIKKINSGVSDTRNEGIRRARGKYLMFVDADDTLTENSISRCCKSAQESNADVILFGISNFKKSNYEYKVLDSIEKEKMLLATLSYLSDDFIRRGVSIDGPVSKFFRSRLVKDNNIFFPLFIARAEDAIFDAYCYEHATTILIDNFDVYNIVLNPDSLTKSYQYRLVQHIPLYLQYEKVFVEEYHNNSSQFHKALAYRAYTGIMEVIYSYFEANPEKKSFQCLKREYNELMTSKIVHECLISLNRKDLISAGFCLKADYKYLLAFQHASYYGYLLNIKAIRFAEFIVSTKLYKAIRAIIGKNKKTCQNTII